MKQSIKQWTSDKNEQKSLIGADSKTDGMYNMNKVKTIAGWRYIYPAFGWCADLGEGWYLPSINELKCFMLKDSVHDAVNHTLSEKGGEMLYSRGKTESYWSSTESHKQSDLQFCAWYVYMYIGDAHPYHCKGFGNYVRAVATFGNSSKSVSVGTVASNATTSAPYKVGDYYNDGVKEGVVFEVSADGRHGKIVSMKESVGILEWSSDSVEQKRLIGADSEKNGAYNMAKVKAIPGWETKYPAFKWCAGIGEGWYLPSKEELLAIYRNKEILDSQLTDELGIKWYWSSTERNQQYNNGYFCVWLVLMSNGATLSKVKDYNFWVRAVSAF